MIAFRVRDHSGQNLLWTLDTGASRVTRPEQIGDIADTVRERVVEIPGNNELITKEVESGEIVLDGSPLCPVGRSVRIGQWTFSWTHLGKPVICRLTDAQATAIQEILGKSSCTFTAQVKGDIPYLNDQQVKTIRDSIDLRKLGSKLTSKRAVESHIEGVCGVEDSKSFLGKKDRVFDKAIEENVLFREHCHILESEHNYDVADFVRTWENCGKDPLKFLNLDIEAPSIEFVEFESGSQSGGVGGESGEKVFDHSSTNGCKGTVTFGEDEVIWFENDGISEEFEDLQSTEVLHPLKAALLRKRHKKSSQAKLEEYHQHCLTHQPSRSDCEICQKASSILKPFVRGSSSGGVYNAEYPHFVVDWVKPSEISSNGSRFLGVVGLTGTSCYFSKGYAVKKGNSANLIHAARLHWQLEDKKCIVHSDNEGVLKDPSVQAYLQNAGKSNVGISQHGVPKRSNTNSRAERFVRTAVEAIRKQLFQAALPHNFWHLAAQCSSIENGRQFGYMPRFNRVHPVPFGTLGRAVLPKEVAKSDKFDSRIHFVACLGIEPTTSGGVKVLYSRGGLPRKATVLDRDVEWSLGEYALREKRDGLVSTKVLFEDFEKPEDKIEQDQACCDLCGKWRFVNSKLHAKVQSTDRFTCDMNENGTCGKPEDPRVWKEHAPEAFIQDGSLKFAEDDDCEVDDFALFAGLNRVQDEHFSSSDETEPDAILSAKRCQEAASSIAACPDANEVICGRVPEVSEEMKTALIRLGAYRVTQVDIQRLKEVAKRTVNAEKHEKIIVRQIVVKNRVALDPNNPKREEWMKGIHSELGSLFEENGVLETASLDDLREGDEILPSLLILTQKNCGRHKARLVAAGNFQKLQPSEAFASVVGHDSWIQHLWLALSLGRKVFQIDICTAFLQTDTAQDVEGRPRTFLRPPRELETALNLKPKTLWRVLRSIYGLRSAPSAWKRTLCAYLTEKGFRSSLLDDAVWICESTGCVALLYVDDLLVLGEDEIARKFLTELQEKFKCTPFIALDDCDEKSPLDFLGHHLWLSRDAITQKVSLQISQQQYCEQILKHFGLENCSALRTLKREDFIDLDKGEKLDDKGLSQLRSVIGSIQYLAQGTRLDVATAIGLVSEGQATGTDLHLGAGKKILRFLKSTCSRRLSLLIHKINDKDLVQISGLFDSSFEPGRARTGVVVQLNNQTTFWFSRRQRCIVLSTAGSELIAASACAKECIGVKHYLESVWGPGGASKLRFRVDLLGDNQAANLIGGGQASLRKVRHLSLSDLFVRQAVDEHGVTITYIRSGLNGSDILTKVLGEAKSQPLLEGLCLHDP